MTLLFAANFDEPSGPVLDLSGNGHDFALSGGLLRTTTGGADPTGYAGQGLGTVDGFADQGPAIFGQTAQRTLSFWLRSTTDFSPGWIWEMHQTAANTGRWGMLALSGNQGFRGTNSSTTGHAARAAVGDSTWHYWAGTYDGTNVRLYYDGTLTATVPLAGPLRTDADVINVFGTAETGNIIRHLRVHDEALDATAITTLMSQPVTAGGPADVPGTVSAVLGGLTAAATATRQVAASGTSTLPGLSSSTVATVGKSGTGPAVLGGVTAVATARRMTGGSAAVTLPGLLVSAAGTVTEPGHPHGTVTLPAPTVTVIGRRTTAGAASVLLGQIIVTARVPVPSGDLGPWLTLGDLMEARATHELIMIDTIGVRHPGMTEGAFDPDLGYAPATPQPEYYHGKATVQARQISSGLVNPAGLGTLTQLGYAVHGPVGSAIDQAAPDDVITVYSSADPRHTGLKLVVRNVESSSFATARRLVCTLYEVSTP